MDIVENISLDKYSNIILVSPYVGGAEIFCLTKCVEQKWSGKIIINTRLKLKIDEHPEFSLINFVLCTGLDSLAEKINFFSIRNAYSAIKNIDKGSRILLGNTRAGSMSIGSVLGNSHTYDCFIHDNIKDSNISFKILMFFISWNCKKLFFPCKFTLPKSIIKFFFSVKFSVAYFDKVRSNIICCSILPNEITVLIIGRIEPNKNQMRAIEILKNLPVKNIKIKLIGSIHDYLYYSSVINKSKSFNFNITQDFVSRSEVLASIKHCDFVLHTSLIEALPLVLFETLSKNKPFFAYGIGGIPEVLQPEYILDESSDYESAHKIFNAMKWIAVDCE